MTSPVNYRQLPKGTYNGITIILSNPSRFDIVALLSGNAGTWFKTEVLFKRNRVNFIECDIRLTSDKTPLTPGTKGVLLLGSEAFHQWTLLDNHLGEQRGYPLTISHNGVTVPAVASYQPQDAWDVQEYEAKLNPFLLDAEDEGDEDKVVFEGKGRKGRTSRANWRFWLQHDVGRLVRIIREYNGTIPAEQLPPIDLYPDLTEVCDILERTKDSFLYLDIETDQFRQLNCIGFMFPDSKIYVVPIYDHTDTLAYADLHRFFKSLHIAFRTNTVVAHNGACFDFPVLAMSYRLAPRRVYDTMVAQARVYPKLEKSLGHCLSMWSWQQYHKDDGILNPKTYDQCRQLWTYNARDVFSLKLIREAQLAFAAKVPGMIESINQVNESILPYMCISLQGIAMEPGWIQGVWDENDKLLNRYLEFVTFLTGYNYLPTSAKQSADYFYTKLGYEVQARSKKTGQPSCDEQALLKLKLKHNNPVIDLAIAIRGLVKESGSLKFSPLTDHWIAPCYQNTAPEKTSEA